MTPAAVAESLQRMTPEQQAQEEALKLLLGFALVQAELEAQLTTALVELIFWQALIQGDGVKDGSNWYAYVNNDPVNFTDPTGLSSSEAQNASAIAVGATTSSAIVKQMIDYATKNPAVWPAVGAGIVVVHIARDIGRFRCILTAFIGRGGTRQSDRERRRPRQ